MAQIEGDAQMDPYTLSKLVQYTHENLAKSRGQRNWKTIFKK
jgi:hypothetical protein